MFCRLELYPDGTGLFANGLSSELYRITRWSTGKHIPPASYEFRASMVEVATGEPAEIKGKVSASGIVYRVDFWYAGAKGSLMREETLHGYLKSLKEGMDRHKAGQGDPPPSER